MVSRYISHSKLYDSFNTKSTDGSNGMYRVQPLVRGLFIHPNKDSRARVKWICRQGRIPAAEQTRAQSSFSAPRSTHLLRERVSVERKKQTKKHNPAILTMSPVIFER